MNTQADSLRVEAPRPSGNGPDVMVELKPEPERSYPSGWTRLRLALKPDSREPFEAKLCVEFRNDRGEIAGVDGSLGPARVSKFLDRVVNIPAGTTRIRLLLTGRQAQRVLGASFEATSKARALVALAGRAATRLAMRPTTWFGQAREVGQLIRRHGASAARRSVRDQVLAHSVELRPSYPIWVEAYDTLTDEARQRWRTCLAGLDLKPPWVTIVMRVTDPGSPGLARAIDSLVRQIETRWEFCLVAEPAILDQLSIDHGVDRRVGECSETHQARHTPAPLVGFAALTHPTQYDQSAATLELVRAELARDVRIKLVATSGPDEAAGWNAALAVASGNFLAVIDPGDELAEDALAWLAFEWHRCPEALVIYSDEDELDRESRRHSPRFKPDWNLDLFHASQYVGRLLAYRVETARSLGGFQGDPEGGTEFDLLLRVLETTSRDQIKHIPRVLYHRRSPLSRVSATALRRHFERSGVEAEVVAQGDGLRVIYPLDTSKVMVSVIIATRDRKALVETIVDGLLHATDYASLEILIIDNESVEPETLAYFDQIQADPRVKVFKSSGAFNYSALNNLGASHARGEVLALLNNDLKVIEPGWLKELVSHAIRPTVGVVGAKLSYADDRIQHAGIIVGMQGVAGHVHKMLPRDQTGYLAMASRTQEFSAVTGACLVCRAEVYRQAGGLDELNLAVSFNDIDFCLKVVELGYRVIFTPHAELYHLESASRGSDFSGPKLERFLREIDHMNRVWKTRMDADPYFNPNLDRLSDQYQPAFPPRIKPPWEDSGQS